MLTRAATVVQVLQDLFRVLLYVLFRGVAKGGYMGYIYPKISSIKVFVGVKNDVRTAIEHEN